MNIAYLISAHTDAPQLKRLIGALQPDAHFFIHIDLKSDLSVFSSLIAGENIHFISERVDVRWGTMIEVQYQIALMRSALQYPVHFDYVFFLSGMDYPLWSHAQITRWLEQQGDKEWLQGICMDTPEIMGQQRELYTIARPYFTNQRLGILARKLLRMLGIRKPLHFMVNGQEWKLYKGSAWWCISQGLLEYIVRTYDDVPAVRQYFQDSFCPAETLIQTIAFNAPQWASRCILTYGAYPGLDALTPLHFIDYNPVIKVMDESDFVRLQDSGKMFCRKVVSGRSDSLVVQLEIEKEKFN